MQTHFSPVIAPSSNNTSPCSTFSALPMNYQAADMAHYQIHGGWEMPQYSSVPQVEDGGDRKQVERFEVLPNYTTGNTTSANTFDWNSFIAHGFNTTTPPTPEHVPSLPHPRSASTEVSGRPQAPCEADDDDNGEVLIGMGLYDTPEKVAADPHLNNYRSTVSSLLGATFQASEPMGRGLKLEETWEPPASDDDEADDVDEDDDDDDDSETKDCDL